MQNQIFNGSDGQIAWQGKLIQESPEFDEFLVREVRDRLQDTEGQAVFSSHLRNLANTGFSARSLQEVLGAQTPEERDWAVGEAMSEALLSKYFGVIWPWNMERDKRNANGSLPGADLIGFINDSTQTKLVVGEVKTSSDTNSPPGVMNGRHGMIHQLDNLVNDLSKLGQVLKWLLPRCKGTQFEQLFDSAVIYFLESGNKAVCLFGVLIRDTSPDENDLKNRAIALSTKIAAPTEGRLLAYYLPCAIQDLPALTSGFSAS